MAFLLFKKKFLLNVDPCVKQGVLNGDTMGCYDVRSQNMFVLLVT